MRIVECSGCGSNDLFSEDEYVICAFCRSRFEAKPHENVIKETVVDVLSDIQRLLKKCDEDPMNSRKYANLILDIDPTNTDVVIYLQ